MRGVGRLKRLLDIPIDAANADESAAGFEIAFALIRFADTRLMALTAPTLIALDRTGSARVARSMSSSNSQGLFQRLSNCCSRC